MALSRIVVASGKVTSRSGKVSFFTTATLSCGFTMIANSLMGDATSESAIDIVRLNQTVSTSGRTSDLTLGCKRNHKPGFWSNCLARSAGSLLNCVSSTPR